MKKKTLTELLGVVTIIAIVLTLSIWSWLSNVPRSASLGASAHALQAQDELSSAAPSTNSAQPIELAPTVFSANQVPMCIFDQLVAPPTSESMLEEYIFPDPQVVLTHTVAIEVVEWLPDNQRLLIKRQISEQTSREYIEVFDTATSQIQRYGETRYSGAEPLWLPAEQAVAYIDFAEDDARTLYINRGTPASESVADQVASRHLARLAEGQQVIYFDTVVQEHPQVLEVLPARKAEFSANLYLPVSEATTSDYGAQYQIEPRPGGTQVAFYNNDAFYLADAASGQICEVDLGTHSGHKQWALSSHWSPNGRYLATFVVIGEPIVPFIHLTVVDMLTGAQRLIDVNNDQLYALAWAPNGRDFLLVGQTPEVEHRHKLYLVDAVTGDSRLVLEDYPFMFTAFHGVAWSSTGQTLALSCPIVDSTNSKVIQRQLCIITVEIKQ